MSNVCYNNIIFYGNSEKINTIFETLEKVRTERLFINLQTMEEIFHISISENIYKRGDVTDIRSWQVAGGSLCHWQSRWEIPEVKFPVH